MKVFKTIFILAITFYCINVSAQNVFFEKDSIPNKKRTLATSISIGTIWAGSITGLAAVWYKDSWGDGFHFFDDGLEWLQMDKFGHAYTGYHLQRNVFNAYNWSGQPRSRSLWLGAALSFGYLANFEILDGFSKDWGFSMWDLFANFSGVAMFTGQELLWEEQKIGFKFSASPSPYAQYRPEALGASFSERLLKDYNGQTYWLNFTPNNFFDTPLPDWLSFSFGYSINEKLHGFENHFVVNHENNLLEFNAYRQYLFSLDVDFEKIKTNKPWLRSIFKALNHVKVPFPALELSKNKISAYPVYF